MPLRPDRGESLLRRWNDQHSTDRSHLRKLTAVCLRRWLRCSSLWVQADMSLP